MSQQLAYVIVTPYSLSKSRTGGILSRLISRTGLDLVAMRMFAPSAELVKEYAEQIISAHDPQDRKVQELLRDYVAKNFAPDKKGHRRRVMVMLFQGDEAVRKVRSVVGNLSPERRSGETIRGTYGDLITDEETGQIRYFEPAVLAAPSP
ncbi:MAG TPA: nucleoside-diphosphate kinase, partial [Desulfuromonadaceae bacterium]|nr:nucleoside-diphosphate kinase [Desulfuromonadaceae bacterium]